MSRHEYHAAVVAALSLVGLGVLFADPLLVTAALIPLVYALFGSFSQLPEDISVAATREFDAAGSTPGQHVTVMLTVENTGSSVLPDVRIIDRVPDELAVVDGSPRLGTPLAPGQSATLTYTVALKRGRFEFTDPVVRFRSLAGTEQQTTTIQAAGETDLTCANTITNPPVSEATLPQAGTVPTDTGGSGLEFYATRQYHHGDPMNRIDWHHVAKTGEFVTVQYRRELAARTVIIVDCRPTARVTYQAGYPTGAAMAAYAGERLYDALKNAGVETSVTAVGLAHDHLTGPDGLPWVHSGSAESPAVLFRALHQTAAENPQSLSVHSPFQSAAVSGNFGIGQSDRTAYPPRADGGAQHTSADREKSEWTRKLLARLPSDGQVIICTPLLDHWPVELARELAGREYPCTVFSPDLTPGESHGQRIGGIQRRHRMRTLRRTAVRVADWRIDRSIEQTLLASFPDLFER